MKKEFNFEDMKGILSRGEMKQIVGGVNEGSGGNCVYFNVSCEIKPCCPGYELICESSEQPVCVVDCN